MFKGFGGDITINVMASIIASLLLPGGRISLGEIQGAMKGQRHFKHEAF